jgi:CRISPR/Cas system-associated endoribonuclease Cas2
MKEKKYVIFFDIPTKNYVLRARVNRALKAINAKMIQRSIWRHDNLDQLIKIAQLINQHGGKAELIEWKRIKV